MRTIAVALIALALIAVPLGIASTASASLNASATSRDLTPTIIGPTATSRLGGGEWVGVRAGDANFGVFYRTATSSAAAPPIAIFAEYTRYLGGADIVNEQDQYLATRGVPVRTILAQSLDRFIEFETFNASAGYDLFSANGTPSSFPVNVPVKALNLRSAAWNVSELPALEVSGTTSFVNFTIEARNLNYTWVNWLLPDARGSGNGRLDLVAFTFHLKIDVATKSADVPWYKVTVTDTLPREVTNVSFLYWKNVTGSAVEMGAKYDHAIEGWDFMNATADRLALETRLIFGNYAPDHTVDFVHLAYAQERAEDANNATLLDNETAGDAPGGPHLYTQDQITFDDQWNRIGRFRWVSDVTVDGTVERMVFQVQGGGRISVSNGENLFFGFWVRGAFVYPAGQSIVHDPAMAAESFVPNVSTGFNLTPLGILLIQVAVVGVAIIPALYLRSKARRPS